MKKILLISGVLLLTALFNNGKAQCNFSGAGVELVGNPYTDPGTGKCMIRFDLYFDLQSNPGGKFIYVHIWPTALYPNLNYSNPPAATDLSNTVLTFGIEHHGAVLAMISSYTPDPFIPNFQFTGLTVTKGPGAAAGYDRFEVEGLVIASSTACSVPQSFTADAWESQSAAAQNVHCFSKGLVFYANDPKILGLLYCQTPRKYKFDISTINTAGLTVDYKVFIDVDGNGVYNKTIDNIQVNSGTATMDAGNSYKFSSGILDYLPYSGQKPYADLPLWVVVSSASLPNEVYGIIINSCFPLPVEFASFTAARKNEMVELKWATATETGNRGFFIERKNGNGDWQQLAFVPTKADNGTSTTLLSYQYTDNNLLRELSQYRIHQQGLDGKNVYSEIRIIKGYGQSASLQVFPNPSADGAITVVLENAGAETALQLVDMNGRIVKTWDHITGNRIFVDGIHSGMYTLRAWPAGTHESISIKLVVGR